MEGGGNRAFIWTADAGMISLGTIRDGSNAWEINAQTQVIGNTHLDDDGTVTVPCLWTASGGVQNLGSLGGIVGMGRGINNRGQVAGQNTTASRDAHARFWSPVTGIKDLGTLPSATFSAGRSINAQGQIAGDVSTAGDQEDLYDQLRVPRPLPVNLDDAHLRLGREAEGWSGSTWGSMSMRCGDHAPTRIPLESGDENSTCCGDIM